MRRGIVLAAALIAVIDPARVGAEAPLPGAEGAALDAGAVGLDAAAVGLDAAAAPSEEADPDAPSVGASLDRTEAHLGDRLTLTVSAVARAGVAVTLPAKLDLGKLEVIDREDGDRAGRDLGDGRRAHRFVLGIAAYDVGELELPPIALSYLNPRGEVRSVQTSPIAVRVSAMVAPEEEGKGPQPPRPPRSAVVEDRRVVRALIVAGAVLAALGVALGAARLLRRARKRRVAASPAAIPGRAPDAVAMERLAALRQAGGYGVDGYRPFYFAVAEVVRAYLGARYGFDSLELTTTELLEELERRAAHLAAPEGAVARFLSDTDLVKFASAGSTDPEALRALDAAQAIVLSTSARLETVAAAISGPVRLPYERIDE